jgi:hypothetical protein
VVPPEVEEADEDEEFGRYNGRGGWTACFSPSQRPSGVHPAFGCSSFDKRVIGGQPKTTQTRVRDWAEIRSLIQCLTNKDTSGMSEEERRFRAEVEKCEQLSHAASAALSNPVQSVLYGGYRELVERDAAAGSEWDRARSAPCGNTKTNKISHESNVDERGTFRGRIGAVCQLARARLVTSNTSAFGLLLVVQLWPSGNWCGAACWVACCFHAFPV